MKITVFTPTFNRGYIISKLYDSLKMQTYKNFEWLVIDDGSTDNTEILFNEWKKEKNEFSIRYIKVDNGGKHRAINMATDIANGELFFIVDSDDYLTTDALETIVRWEKTIKDKKLFCGISGNRGRTTKEIIGTTFKGNYIDATALERKKLNINGDKAEVYYTKILRQYKFPEFEGENFVTECTVWEQMAYDGYKVRWFNHIIYISDYLNDGLTKRGDLLYSNNPKGTAYIFKQQIKMYNYNLKERMSTYNAYYNLVKINIDMKEAAKNLDIRKSTLLVAIWGVKIKNILLKNSSI